jgi:hypothetical protein
MIKAHLLELFSDIEGVRECYDTALQNTELKRDYRMWLNAADFEVQN